MANENMIKFLRGNVANLPQNATAGALYFTKDEGIYLGMDDGSYHRYGDFITVTDVKALPATGAHATCMYYCTAENILARYDSVKGWIQINKQPTAEEMKTLLGLGSAAYTDASAYDAAGSADAVRAYVGVIPNDENGDPIAASVVAYINKKTDGIATSGNLEALGARVTTAEGEIDALQEALPGKSDVGHKHVKDDITDFAHTHIAEEITDLDATIKAYDYATKGEAQGYANAKDEAIAEAKKAGTDAADALDAYKGEMVTALAGKQSLIPENTYDAHGAAAQALVDAKTYADGLNDVVQDALEVLYGEGDGSVSKALADAKEYAEGYVEEYTNSIAGNYDISGAAAQALADAKTYVDNADKFEIDMLTVNAHGGVAAGTDLNGLTTHEILKKILYPYVEPTLGNATASPNGGTYEKGVTKTITSVSISVTKKSEAITSVALYNGSTLIEEKTGDAVKNGGTITFSNVNVEVPTNGNQLTVKVTDAANKTYSKNTTAMAFVYPYYMGSCAVGTTIDETLVESLTKKIESKGTKSCSFTVSDGHMVFAYPAAHKTLKSILDPNGFETLGNYTRHDITVTGLDGSAQSYYVYVSGATTVDGFTVKFTHNS